MLNDFWKEIMGGGVQDSWNHGKIDTSSAQKLITSINELINLPAMNLDTQKRTNDRVMGNKVLDWGNDFDYKSRGEIK